MSIFFPPESFGSGHLVRTRRSPPPLRYSTEILARRTFRSYKITVWAKTIVCAAISFSWLFTIVGLPEVRQNQLMRQITENGFKIGSSIARKPCNIAFHIPDIVNKKWKKIAKIFFPLKFFSNTFVRKDSQILRFLSDSRRECLFTSIWDYF